MVIVLLHYPTSTELQLEESHPDIIMITLGIDQHHLSETYVCFGIFHWQECVLSLRTV